MCVLGQERDGKVGLELGDRELPPPHASGRQAEIIRASLAAAMTSVKGGPLKCVPQGSWEGDR